MSKGAYRRRSRRDSGTRVSMRGVRVSEKMSKAGWPLGLGKKTQQISVDK